MGFRSILQKKNKIGVTSFPGAATERFCSPGLLIKNAEFLSILAITNPLGMRFIDNSTVPPQLSIRIDVFGEYTSTEYG
jgi:hypothetical protein